MKFQREKWFPVRDQEFPEVLIPAESEKLVEERRVQPVSEL